MVLKTEPKRLDLANTAKVLYDFEQQHFHELSGFQLKGWNMWQVCKAPLYFNLLSAATSSNHAEAAKPAKGILKRYAQGLARFFHNYLWIFSRNKVLFFTYSADKLSQDQQGRFYNSLVDPILQCNLFDRSEILLIEQPHNGGILKPATFSPHVNKQVFDVWCRVFRKDLTHAEQRAMVQLARVFTRYLVENGIRQRLSLSYFRNILLQFKSERAFYRLLFRIIKPSRIISSEQMGKGLLAAATELKIKLYELQHGAMDEYYPYYVFDRRFRTLPNNMRPHRLLVFGQLAKDLLIRKGYFKESEIIAVGKYDMEVYRLKYPKRDSLNRKILFVTQPYMHKECLLLTKQVLCRKVEDLKYILKAHPLQRPAEMNEYKHELLKSDHVSFSSTTNIYELIDEADLVVGFFSTALEEAASLSKPCISIKTPTMPYGIHGKTGNSEMRDIIRVAEMDDVADLIRRFYVDRSFRKDWLDAARLKMNYIYETGYQENIACLKD
jgi:hypothetical protein